MRSTHANTVQMRMEQVTFPAITGSQHCLVRHELLPEQRALRQSWPWQPNQTYYVRIVNTTQAAP